MAKTKVVFFTRRNVPDQINLKMYGEDLEKGDCFKYLGRWFDKKLTWVNHIETVVDKCKRILNVLRCLRGKEWGANRTSLKTLYIGLIRAVIDYGSIVYQSASKVVLKKLDTIHYEALRLCCGAMKTTPVSAL